MAATEPASIPTAAPEGDIAPAAASPSAIGALDALFLDEDVVAEESEEVLEDEEQDEEEE